MDNLDIYNKVREVPKDAQKSISGGRLKGMTDINPMWRIKTLTEVFGPVGLGWYYNITDKRLSPGANDEIAAFVDIELFVKQGDAWSAPIRGTGGAMFVTKEKNGPYTSDECFKMALTDAISVACKALGVGADVYWQKDRSKYDQTPEQIAAAKAATYGTSPEEETRRKELLTQIDAECKKQKKVYRGDLSKLTTDELAASLAKLVGNNAAQS